MKVGKTTDKLMKKKSTNVKTNGGLGLDRGGILLDTATISPTKVTDRSVLKKVEFEVEAGTAVGAKKSIRFGGEILPDCPLDHASLAEELNSIDVQTKGVLDLDHGNIHELKPELTSFDLRKNKKKKKKKKKNF